MDPVLRDPFINSRISRRWQEHSVRYLHVTDPNVRDAEPDKLLKVRPLLTTLQTNFPSLFTQGRALSIDKAMVKINGWLAWKQYMLKKPVKWGIKTWCLCEALTGYCLGFEVYTGKAEEPRVGDRTAYSVIMRLMWDYNLCHHHL